MCADARSDPVASKRPWACLLPNYCATKKYFQSITEPCGGGLVFGVPRVSYDFEHPEGTGHQASPFFSLWFFDLGVHAQPILRWFRESMQRGEASLGGFKLCCNVGELADRQAVKVDKRPNPRQRKAARKKAMSSSH
jgi:hypothetical protein